MKRYFLFSVILTQLIGCSKSENSLPDPDPLPVPKILSKVITVDTTKVAPNDTTNVASFDYDAQGRISKQTFYNVTAGIQQFYSSFTFTYTGTDTLASTIMENLSSPPIAIRWKHFFTYNAANQLITDSSQRVFINGTDSDSSVSAIKYEHQSNSFSSTNYHYYPGMPTIEPASTRTIRRDLNKNIICSFPAGESGFATFIDYDNHVNPLFKLLPLNLPYNSTPHFPYFLHAPFLEQRTNIAKVYVVTYDAIGNISNQVLQKEYITIFHENGMPSTVRLKSTPASFSDKFKYVFIYK